MDDSGAGKVDLIELAKRVTLGIIVALAVFSLVEGVLWMAGVAPLHQRADPYVGFAGYSPLFVERAQPDGLPVFVTSPGKLRWFNRQQFPVRKSDDATRIFCLGGSTTYGRPYDDQTSFCGWLREFLPAANPERRWEVINAGGISYASYRVVRLMEALSRHEPDLFIIYTGHNEFLEKRTYGQLLDTPEFVRDLASLASRLRVYTVLWELIVDRRDQLPTEVDAVLDRSVGPEHYHRDDAEQRAVIEHFQVSLKRMVEISKRSMAPLIFVTPASNIGDFSPFKSEPSPGLSPNEAEQISKIKQEASEALDEGDAEQAVELTGHALEVDPRDAELLFIRGRALRALGHTEEARRTLVAARDEDVAPLRALSEITNTVRRIAREEDVGVVDFALMMRERSSDQIPDSDFFLDHVHPTVEGNRLLALAIIDEMVRMGKLVPNDTWNRDTIAEISDRMKGSIDAADHTKARKSLANVLIWAGKHEEAARLVDESLTDGPNDAETQFQKATLLVREGKFVEALPHLEEATRSSPQSAPVWKEYGIVLSELGRKKEALDALRRAADLDASLHGVHYELGIVLDDMGNSAEAEAAYRTELAANPEHSDACNNLGVLLATQGNIDAALSLFERAVRADPNNANAAENFARAKRMRRN